MHLKGVLRILMLSVKGGKAGLRILQCNAHITNEKRSAFNKSETMTVMGSERIIQEFETTNTTRHSELPTTKFLGGHPH